MFGSLGIATGGGGLAGAAALIVRAVMGNGNLTPYNFTATSNRVLNFRIRKRVALNANWLKPKLTFVNFSDNSTGETTTTYPDIVIRFGLKYSGAFYAGNFNATRDKVIIGGDKAESDDVATPSMTAGSFYFECIRLTLPLLYKTKTVSFRVGETVTGGTSGATGVIARMVDGTTGSLTLLSETGQFVDGEVLTGSIAGAAVVALGAGDTQSLIYSRSSHVFWQEGVRSGNDSSVDWTTSEPVTYPSYTANLSGGNITSVTKVSGGTGWSGAAPSLYAYEVQSDGQIAWKNIGYGNLSGGTVTSATVTSGAPPAGYTWTNPTIIFGGGSGFGGNSACYMAAMTTAIPSVAGVKVAGIVGTSIERGDSSTDSTGDQYGNHGAMERAIANRCGVINMSTAGAKASYYVQYATLYPKLFALYMGMFTHGILAQATNDAQAGDSKATIETNNNAIKTYIKGFGALVGFQDVLPRTTGTLSPESSQTYETGFGPGGVVDLYDADLSNGTMVGDFGPILQRSYFTGTDPNKWAVTGARTTDLIHPNLAGHAYLAGLAAYKAQFSFLA